MLTEKAVAPHSTTLAWKIPWMEEPGRLQSMGSLRVGHDWATSLFFSSLSFSLSCVGERNGNPLQCSCLEDPRDGGAWWAAVYGVAQSWTRLKWLSSSLAAASFVKTGRQWLPQIRWQLKKPTIVSYILPSLIWDISNSSDQGSTHFQKKPDSKYSRFCGPHVVSAV